MSWLVEIEMNWWVWFCFWLGASWKLFVVVVVKGRAKWPGWLFLGVVVKGRGACLWFLFLPFSLWMLLSSISLPLIVCFPFFLFCCLSWSYCFVYRIVILQYLMCTSSTTRSVKDWQTSSYLLVYSFVVALLIHSTRNTTIRWSFIYWNVTQCICRLP
jgi:hypothetical protein